MSANNSMSIGEALVAYLRENGLEQSVLDEQVEAAWPKVMGDIVNRMTRSVEVKDGVLIVRVSSAALKTQLFENRFELVRKLNEAVGAPALKDCRAAQLIWVEPTSGGCLGADERVKRMAATIGLRFA